MSEYRKIGFIESTPFLYSQLEELGVPARVWDEVCDLCPEQPGSQTPHEFDEMLYDLRCRQPKFIDYGRADDVSDRDYALNLLKQARSYINSHPVKPWRPEGAPSDVYEQFERLNAFGKRLN